jgi:hypothetical protein
MLRITTFGKVFFTVILMATFALVVGGLYKDTYSIEFMGLVGCVCAAMYLFHH